MMVWNYRLVRHKSGYISIREAYYLRVGAEPDSLTVDGVDVGGDTLEEVQETYKMMAEAFRAPIIDEVEFDRRIQQHKQQGGHSIGPTS